MRERKTGREEKKKKEGRKNSEGEVPLGGWVPACLAAFRSPAPSPPPRLNSRAGAPGLPVPYLLIIGHWSSTARL